MIPILLPTNTYILCLCLGHIHSLHNVPRQVRETTRPRSRRHASFTDSDTNSDRTYLPSYSSYTACTCLEVPTWLYVSLKPGAALFTFPGTLPDQCSSVRVVRKPGESVGKHVEVRVLTVEVSYNRGGVRTAESRDTGFRFDGVD